jgi:hypothetical protein
MTHQLYGFRVACGAMTLGETREAEVGPGQELGPLDTMDCRGLFILRNNCWARAIPRGS